MPTDEAGRRSDLPWYGRLGHAMSIVAWLVAVPSILMPAQLVNVLDLRPNTATGFGLSILAVAAVGVATAVFLKLVGFYLYDRARRSLAANAADVLEKDNRPPVLYLRSFDDDAREASLKRALNAAPTPVIEESAERVLADYLRNFGPVVAIGQPGEALPETGFARLYATHDQWQSTVIGLLDRAALIVLRAGHSPGVLWETEQVLRRVPRHNVIVLIPEGRHFDFERYRQDVRRLTAVDLPGMEESTLKRFPLGVRAIVLFDGDGKPQLRRVEAAGPPPPSINEMPKIYWRWMGRLGMPWFRPATVDFMSFLVRALQPVFARHALQFADPAVEYDERMRPGAFDRWYRRAAWSIVIAVAALFLFALILLLFVVDQP